MPEDPLRERLFGTWRLLSVVKTDLATGETSDLWGDSPVGYINYGPDGRMIVINARSDRAKPAGSTPTPEEAQALFNSVLAYAGTYTIDGNEITHHVDISWNESWTGTRQVRTFRLEGDRVMLSTKPSPDPVDGTMSVRIMTWEKLK
jgi:hypothetical protein